MTDNSTVTAVRYKDLDFLGYPGYRVGDNGSVWSRRRPGPAARCGVRLGEHWRELKHALRPKGYPFVTLYPATSRRGRIVTLSRLILTAFIGPCPAGMEACHSNGNTTDNRLANLRWDTHRHNEEDKIGQGTRLRGEAHSQTTLTEAQVREIRALYAAGGHSHKKLAEMYGVCESTARNVICRITWMHIA